MKILVLCTGNSCRSQIADGYLNCFIPSASIYSAGIETHGVNPMAIRVMKDDDIDISSNTSNNVDEYHGVVFDYVITVCDNAKDVCPSFPTKSKLIHHSFPDPGIAEGNDDEVFSEFIKVRDMIKEFCKSFAEDIEK